MKEIKNNRQMHVHIDADAFFASVEQVLHRELRGKAIVVGQNGGIVSALSYPAKGMGIPRVMPIVTVRKRFPNVDVVASDFYAYGIFSARIERIIREYLPNLVKNSIDECSSHIGEYAEGFQGAQELVEEIQEVLSIKLGCTFSFGIARTPLLAKLASGMNKPNGITILTDENIKNTIYDLPINSVSGVGKKGFEKLQRHGVRTIGDFVSKKESWLRCNFSICMPAIQKQLLGIVITVPKAKISQKSMSRGRSFPRTESYKYLHSQLTMNIEHLAQRMRKDNVVAKRIGVQLRTQDLIFSDTFTTLTTPSRDPGELVQQAKRLLQSIYVSGVEYRQVSVTCSGLEGVIQYDLFGELEASETHVLDLIDGLETKFGKSCIGFASSLEARNNLTTVRSQKITGDTYPHPILPGEETKKRLVYPFLGKVG